MDCSDKMSHCVPVQHSALGFSTRKNIRRCCPSVLAALTREVGRHVRLAWRGVVDRHHHHRNHHWQRSDTADRTAVHHALHNYAAAAKPSYRTRIHRATLGRETRRNALTPTHGCRPTARGRGGSRAGEEAECTRCGRRRGREVGLRRSSLAAAAAHAFGPRPMYTSGRLP